MRLVLALAVLALSSAAPAYASPDGATGGAAMPPGTTGGITAQRPRATQPPPSRGSSLGALAATGLAVAAFVLLGAATAAAGIGLRRLAR